MSLKLQKIAFQQPIKDSSAKFLLVVMSYLSADGEVWADRSKLMSMTSLCQRSITSKLKYLVDECYLQKIDTYRFKIVGANLADLPANPANPPANPAGVLANPAHNSANPASPYIENGINGKGTVMNGIVSISQFLEGADMGGIPREFARQWYERQEEQGWFWNINTGKPKPFAVKDALMIRFCLREFNSSDRISPKKSKNNGASVVYQVETKLRFIKNQKINHPGDPKREVAVSPKSDERREWWELVASEEKLESEMKELMKA